MTKFTKRTTSPFRYDIVGSFLRPDKLKRSRAQFEAGQITAIDLRKIEDDSITELVHKEEALGLKAITDGEFRRSWWHLDFFWGLQGVQKASTQEGYEFHDEETRRETARLIAPLGGNNHPFVEHFKFTRDQASSTTQVKQTIPAPGQFWTELQRPENIASWQSIYPTAQKLQEAIVQAYKQVINDLYVAGCRTIQFDDCTWGALAEWEIQPEKIPNYGIQPEQIPAMKQDLVDLNNSVLQDLPADLTVNTHVCRGNYHSTWANSGSYDSVSDPLFTREKVGAYYLEYDTARAGGFEPLAKVSGDKKVVLGLVTSKSGTLEKREDIIARVQAASEYIDLDRLAISPQCGFASTEEGNILTEQQQWDKIKLLQSIADEVWS
ncbi:5-methyltetrahydropteroyltriglutamate--homocysteine S-methyltransferase [Bombilactobacillus thymidiniphilus]|uniref:5-methyltetrahydropteroyltriglutamate--homocysteine S-methyltransferase n=1 Tax=Bombilactobacillus thymidiniphilus TaxID=2923363 RepID=A0ABY4PDU5_9LACO|nr:5-methyltetrahydropteroyltriglutamate--homocysteine S-methyltransferase [Bombilactobacillus thymidiniphilus]UQS83915.1 5-methyltetrahydropteroyltriglutamate--homocysteine S-methyltransferase [Bombilactobacillus thymidiniphilus]